MVSNKGFKWDHRSVRLREDIHKDLSYLKVQLDVVTFDELLDILMTKYDKAVEV